MEVSPADSLEIEYSISHGSYADDAYVEIYEAEDLVKLFPARTFIFEDDLNQEIYEIKNFDLTIRCEPNKINPVGLFYALGLLTIDKVKDDKVI